GHRDVRAVVESYASKVAHRVTEGVRGHDRTFRLIEAVLKDATETPRFDQPGLAMGFDIDRGVCSLGAMEELGVGGEFHQRSQLGRPSCPRRCTFRPLPEIPKTPSCRTPETEVHAALCIDVQTRLRVWMKG